jgi:uncharacterized protein YndB with AHSA1/START domain
MSMKSNAITVSTTVNAPVARAWEVFTTPEHIVQWNFAADTWHCPTATNEASTGGSFNWRMEAKDGSMGFDFAGTYTQVKPLELLQYDIGDREVQVKFEALSSEQTRVTEVFDIENENSGELQRNGWQAILDNYKKRVESL